MARNVVTIYDDFQTANAAVRDLIDNGFPRDNISLVANNTRGEYGYTGTSTTPDIATGTESMAEETGAGAGVGTGIGGIGGLLIGLGALTIPGIGPIIAAGPLAVTLSTLTGVGVGAVAGSVTGGLLGALIGLGIPEEEAGYYAESVQRGGILVTVQAEDQNAYQIMDIMNHHNPVNINERVDEWRSQGWVGFDQNTQEQNSTRGTPAEQPANPPMNPDVTRQELSPAGKIEDQTTRFDPNSDVYRTHYNTYLSNTGYPYEYYIPAYQYGYHLASDARYQNNNWEAMEPRVRQDWERQNPGTWDRFRTAIRISWENASGR